MLHCLQTPENLNEDMTVLERQQARLKWQQKQQQQELHEQHQQEKFQFQKPEQSCFINTHFNELHLPSTAQQIHSDLINNDSIELQYPSMKTDPDLENGWPGFEKYPIPRTDLSVGRESSKKRKTDKAHNPKSVGTEDINDKRIKGNAEEISSKLTEHTNNKHNFNPRDNSKENSKVSEVQKTGYIHVRARRGQATDSHSLAERVRREKISERMRYLQDLVPGCNKIIGKAGMLDEIINYVQALQRQVEFLSMKLATVNPNLDFNIINFFPKEMFSSCTDNFPTVDMLSEVVNPPYLQFNQQEVDSCYGLDMRINHSEMPLERTTNAPILVPEEFLDSSCFSQTQPSSTWETDLQSLCNVEFHPGRSTAFQSEPFTVLQAP